MSERLNLCGALAARCPCTTRVLATALLALTLAGCFPGDLTSQDYSSFQTYSFRQAPGLGFCGDTDRVFSSQITRTDEGSMIFAASILVLAGPDPTDCEDGVAAQEGCFRPKVLPPRTLQATEASEVEAVFSKVNFHRNPMKICREIAVDPCLIDKHAWDGEELSDYVCGRDRLGEEQSTALRQLLSDLHTGG